MKSKTFSIILLVLTSTILTGCFATKTILLDDKAISKKKLILLHQNENVFELRNFNFDANNLTGTLFKSFNSDLPKSKKVKWLEVYLDPAFNIDQEVDSNSFVKIPLSSITKIDKTRFRAEYGLLAIPIWLIGGLIIYFGGAILFSQG